MNAEQQIKKEIALLTNTEKITYVIQRSSFKPNVFLNNGQSVMFYFQFWIKNSDHKFEMFYDPKTDNIILCSVEIPEIFMTSSEYESIPKLFNFVMNCLKLSPFIHKIKLSHKKHMV